MLYKDDWEKAKQKYLEYWNCENHDRPLISVTAPRDGYIGNSIKPPENIVDRWMDTDYVIKRARENFAATYFGGEAFPALNPNLGPDILGGFLGCELEFGERTSWAVHFLEDWNDKKSFKFNPDNKWWKKIKEITDCAIADAKGDYLVGITDLHPGMDGIVSLRGPEEVCMDCYDNPEALKKASFEILEVFKEVVNDLYGAITASQEGVTNWMGIWHPGKWYVTSCDLICMISKEMVAEFVLPELLEELKFLDASVFHLDGPGALKHLNALLEIPDLNGIQWVYGAGQPSASHWIPVLRKIQQAGKLIQVHIQPEELDILMENLKPEGVMFVTACDTEQDARDLLRKAEGFYTKKY